MLLAFEEVEKKWRGTINKSALAVAKETDKHFKNINKYDSTKKICLYSSVALLVFYFLKNGINGFDIMNMFTPFNVSILIIGFGLLFYYTHLEKQKQSLRKKFDDFKNLLIKRIDADFCHCITQCAHKEEFMEDIQKECGINLYF
jgi:hypothetical protein